ncbi:diaminopimelate epimerase [bacterium]|nr:diaminopimelate epimerase [bacterium]
MMKKKVKYTIISGSGNTFTIVNEVLESLPTGADKLAQLLCSLKGSRSTDGLLLMLSSKNADLKMVYLNRDGSIAEMCGNGLRCFAYLASQNGYDNPIRIQTDTGLLEAIADGGTVKVQMPKPKKIKLGQSLKIGDDTIKYDFVMLGVPHCIIRAEDISSLDVNKLGSKIRYMTSIFPRGTNVDFIKIADEHNFSIRTYERGVEKETLACGTGVVASGLISFLNGEAIPPVKAKVRSGEYLTAYFNYDKDKFENVYLEGPVTILEYGETEVETKFFS